MKIKGVYTSVICLFSINKFLLILGWPGIVFCLRDNKINFKIWANSKKSRPGYHHQSTEH